MFSFRGHTPFDTLQYLLGFSVVLCGTIWPWHLPWQLTVPITLVIALPGMARMVNGVEAQEAAKRAKIQEYLEQDGE